MQFNNIADEVKSPSFINSYNIFDNKNMGQFKISSMPVDTFVRESKDSDDDNSFLPPALSAYGSALLEHNFIENDVDRLETQSKGKITGIYEHDFPDHKSKSTFRDRLSVRFNENFSNLKSDTSLNDQVFDAALDISPNKTKNTNSSHTPVTPNGISSSISNPNTSSNINSNTSSNKISETSVHTIRSTLRGNRRFTKLGLGPPKRAARISNEGMNGDSAKDISIEKESDGYKISKLHTPPPSFNLELSFKKSSPYPNNKDISFSDSNSKEILDSIERSQDLVKMKQEHEEKITSEKIRLEKESRVNPFERERSDLFKKQKSEHKQQIQHHDFIDMMESKNDYHLKEMMKNISKTDSSVGSELEKPDGRQEDHNLQRKMIQPKKAYILDNSKSHAPAIKNENDFFRRPLSSISPNLNNLPESKQLLKLGTVAGTTTSNEAAVAMNKKGSNINSNSDPKGKKYLIVNGIHYEKLELLGRGGSSKVYKVKSSSNNKIYAIKKVTFDQFDETCVKGFKGEIDLLLKLKSQDRVVKLIDYHIGDGSISLVMECGDIDLAHVLNNRSDLPLDLNFVKYHAIEMLKCVSAVHEGGVVHSDLKPANFLFVKGVLKIIDFGIANAVPDHTVNIYRESQIGTPNYMAPEALIEVNQGYSYMTNHIPNSTNVNTWKVGKPSDVWSCGCIIYQMIYGRPPYGGYSGNQRIIAIMNPQVQIQYPERGLGGRLVPKGAIQTMRKCLDRDPCKRWTVEEILNGPFLNPKVVSEDFIRDLVHSAVNFGVNNKHVTSDIYDKLVETVLKQIDDLNY